MKIGPHQDLQGLRTRIGYLRIALYGFFLLLVLRAWYLQVLEGARYKDMSENNRIRLVKLPAPRGFIYDREGRLLVTNTPAFDLTVTLEDIPNREDVLARLEELISLDRDDALEKISSWKPYRPHQPLRLRKNITLTEVALVESHRDELPGVGIEIDAQRKYLYNGLSAHLLGYLGEAPREFLEGGGAPDIDMGDTMGMAGVERSYDTFLRGQSGEKGIEVDAVGHEVNVLHVQHPSPGSDVFLTLDLRVQKAAEEALGSEAGAVIAMDPRNGEILALVSHPSFDPNLLSRGVTPEEWEKILQDSHHPLTNRAVQGLYPPGSLFKIVVATSALDTEAITPSHTVHCRGVFPFGRRLYRDWKEGGHGDVDLHKALVESCDLYFYDLGNRVGIDTIAEFAARYGLGQATGIGVLEEKKGQVPSTEWKKRVKGEIWFPGETLSVSIGQSYVTVTPLQMATFISSIANGGFRPQPTVLRGRRSKREGVFVPSPVPDPAKIHVREETLAILKEALRGVVAEPAGTGGRARSPFVSIAGKTGTAQVVSEDPHVKEKDRPKELRDHAWFIAYAPADDPKIAVVILVEHGGGGGAVAAPVARKIIEEYFKNEQVSVERAG